MIMEELPMVLSIEELNKALFDSNNGDILARNKVIEHNIRLVYKMVNKYFNNTGYDDEDLVSLGYIGLIKAAQTYDCNKKIAFATYAGKCIFNEILMFVKSNNKYNNDVSMNDIAITTNDGDELDYSCFFVDSSVSLEDDLINKDILCKLKDIVSKLSGIEREIIMMRYGFNDGIVHGQSEVACLFNISQPQVSRIERRVVERIRKELKDMGIVEKDVKKKKKNKH